MFTQVSPIMSFVRTVFAAADRVAETIWGRHDTQDEIILEVRLDAVRSEQQDAHAA